LGELSTIDITSVAPSRTTKRFYHRIYPPSKSRKYPGFRMSIAVIGVSQACWSTLLTLKCEPQPSGLAGNAESNLKLLQSEAGTVDFYIYQNISRCIHRK
jgi:hypothetical protein